MFNDRTLVGLTEADLNLPIYRIYPKKYALQILRTGQDVLVNPSKWEDPFENFMLARTQVLDGASGQLISLQNLAKDWYGQCWSLQEESDAMWRIYSPNTSGDAVKAKTTIGKLLENLKASKTSNSSIQMFVGRVEYVDQPAIAQLMGLLTFMDVAHSGQGDGFAKLLSIKREAFQHEAEVRSLVRDNDTPRLGKDGLFRYSLDPNDVFEEFVLDPRLEHSLAALAEAELKAAGWKHTTRRSDLYQIPSFTIRA